MFLQSYCGSEGRVGEGITITMFNKTTPVQDIISEK
jgi:hypothetical protein